MSYAKEGFPVEAASKIGQLRIINDPFLQGLIQSFESPNNHDSSPLVNPSGNLDLSKKSQIQRIIAIDGGEAILPHPLRRKKTLGILTAASLHIKMEEYNSLVENPLIDPRELSSRLEEKLWYRPTAIPLSGVSIPGMNVKESVRAVINSSLSNANTGLIGTLKFLVFREWYATWPNTVIPPHMDCLSCGQEFYLPFSNPSVNFKCSNCDFEHYLSDYMGIAEGSDDLSRESTVSNLRNVIETLILFDWIRKYSNNPPELEKILFIKDGPLMLRAQLARLVEPIRDYLCFLRDRSIRVNIVGIEKNGVMVDLVNEFKNSLPNIGDYFLPSVKFLVEDISGKHIAGNHRNRVSYGAKIAVRLGNSHLVVIHIPTGEFLMEPSFQDLIGFEDSARVLSNVLSHRYENALAPLVLINSLVSISRNPSNKVLQNFVDEFI